MRVCSIFHYGTPREFDFSFLGGECLLNTFLVIKYISTVFRTLKRAYHAIKLTQCYCYFGCAWAHLVCMPNIKSLEKTA
jgi:ABC-type uncharacterized transport system permease subunit